jgi:hypothetical protein
MLLYLKVGYLMWHYFNFSIFLSLYAWIIKPSICFVARVTSQNLPFLIHFNSIPPSSYRPPLVSLSPSSLSFPIL